jgi:homoprotocatechuate degradation regulator HpaR
MKPNAGGSREPMRAFSRSLPMALLRTREAVMAEFRPVLREHDLTEQQWRVLRALTAASGPRRFGEIGDDTCISGPSLSRLARTLEVRGIIRRTTEADDLRAAQLSLTRAGRSLVAKVAPQSEAAYARIAERLGAAGLERLYAVLERTLSRLDTPSP